MIDLVLFGLSTSQQTHEVWELLDSLQHEEINVSVHLLDINPILLQLAHMWLIPSLPTTLVIAEREEKYRFVGVMNREELDHVILGHLQRDILSEPSGGVSEGCGDVLRNSSGQEDTGTNVH